MEEGGGHKYPKMTTWFMDDPLWAPFLSKGVLSLCIGLRLADLFYESFKEEKNPAWPVIRVTLIFKN